MALIDQQSGGASNGSSLSDASEHNEIKPDDFSSHSGSIRASSHTSSRDWGWFEDVHESDKKKKSKPNDDDGASGPTTLGAGTSMLQDSFMIPENA